MSFKRYRAVMRPSVEDTGEEKAFFSDETMQSLRELGDVLRAIHRRLIAEGHLVRDGTLVGSKESDIICNQERENEQSSSSESNAASFGSAI